MLHERFDIAKWKQYFDIARSIDGERITSPYDIVVVETIREKVLTGFDVGATVPTDVFIMTKGEPANRAVTKIGGLPYWSKDRPWPRDIFDRPLTFVAQFNFADSKDITGPLPGDILLLFANEEVEDTAQLIWISVDESIQLVDSVPETEWVISPCYGAIYRTEDFPEVSSELFEDYSEPYLLPCLEATKIGGVPSYIQEEEATHGRFICQLSSVQPSFKQPFPYINVPEPITAFQYIEDPHGLMIGDMGSCYLFMDDEGEVHISEQGY